MDEEGVLDFLTSLEAMDLPDRIEEVNAKILLKIIEDTDFVAVLFCKYSMFHSIAIFKLSKRLLFSTTFVFLSIRNKEIILRFSITKLKVISSK